MIKYTIPGLPQAQGSKRVFNNVLVETNKNLRPWRATAACLARDAMNGAAPLAGAVAVTATFVFPRPKSHYRTGKLSHVLRDDAPFYKSSKPDVDKLQRALYDSLTGTILGDDSQIARYGGTKIYGDVPGVVVEVEPL